MKQPGLTNIESETLRHIRNNLVHTGRMPSYRELMLLLEYKSPRSVGIIIHSLIEKGYLTKNDNKSFQLSKFSIEIEDAVRTVKVPLVGNIACGNPIFAEDNIETTLSVSTKLARPPYKYFILRAKGDSMNLKGINDGNLVLIRQINSAINGDIVVALIDDEATLKEFQRINNLIVLKPYSTNPIHQPIILTDDFRIQGQMVTILPNI